MPTCAESRRDVVRRRCRAFGLTTAWLIAQGLAASGAEAEPPDVPTATETSTPPPVVVPTTQAPPPTPPKTAPAEAKAPPSAATKAKSGPPDRRWEPTFLPVVANDPDVGFKFGLFAQLARYRDELKPYAWRLQFSGVLSVQEGPTGTEFPYRSLALRHDLPGAFGGNTRLFSELIYSQTTNLGYFGLGNTSVAAVLWKGLESGSEAYVRARRFYQYDSTLREIGISILQSLSPGWRIYGGIRLRWIEISPYAGSLLANQIRDGPGGDRGLDGLGQSIHPLLFFGVVYDSRDHETVPTRGGFHEATLRCSPSGYHDGGWCGATGAVRGYAALLGRRLSLAGRLLGDVLYGHPPLFELARIGGLQPTYGPGGGLAVRGLPQGRYQGNTKLVGNFEVRSFFWPFSFGSQRFELGAVAFFDVGRVWTNTFNSVPALDGTGLALRYGTGGGLRLRWGDSLVIRIDASYSPVAGDLGAAVGLYMDVDPMF
jgi:hypothetical protein